MVKTQLCVVKPSKILGLGQWDGVIYESQISCCCTHMVIFEARLKCAH